MQGIEPNLLQGIDVPSLLALGADYFSGQLGMDEVATMKVCVGVRVWVLWVCVLGGGLCVWGEG
jgi:hypothetical protein